MRHDCTRHGCYREQHVVNFAGVHESLSDIDAIIERHGYALILEWKSTADDCNVGQEILFKQLSRLRHPESGGPAITCAEVIGSAGAPTAEWIRLYRDGEQGEWSRTTIEALRRSIEFWKRSKEKAAMNIEKAGTG